MMDLALHVAVAIASEVFSSVFRSSDVRPSATQAGIGPVGGLSWLGMAVALAVVVWWLHAGLPLPSIDVAGQLAGRR